MTPQQWKTICEKVTNEWNVRLVGTGSYVSRDALRMVLSCEHVAQEQPMHYRFYGSDDVFEHEGPWVMEKHPIDAALAAISDSAWNACSHQAQVVPVERFALRHAPSQQAEILFFRGFSGGNAQYAFDVHQTNGTG